MINKLLKNNSSEGRNHEKIEETGWDYDYKEYFDKGKGEFELNRMEIKFG